MEFSGNIFRNGKGLATLEKIAGNLPKQSTRMPVLFSSHGNPMDIVLTRHEKLFWDTLYQLGGVLESNFDVKAVLVISAHWCTQGTYVNIATKQQQIFDYKGFPPEYYQVYYQAKGAPEIAREISNDIPHVHETTDWGLDHGAWPMLMHLFPKANIPVFQMSLNYDAAPSYHYDLGIQLKSLRDKGVLIIGSGSMIHNLKLATTKFFAGDTKPYGWEIDYDAWLKKQLDDRNFDNIINYQHSHPAGKLAAPTPDHFVPVLYTLGLMDKRDEIVHFFEDPVNTPAFSERSFIIGNDLQFIRH
jgi:4,5-DOPA dioxygenase extradiol